VVYQSSVTQLMVDAEEISGRGAGRLYLPGEELWA
jgi:hypothetical protein